MAKGKGMGGMPGMPGGMGGMPGGMGGMPGGMGGMPGVGGGMPGGTGGMGGMEGMFSDPDIMGAMSNPKFMKAVQELMQDPSAFAKYQDDPEVMNVMTKLMGKFGVGAGGMPDLSAMFGGGGGREAQPSSGTGDVEDCD